jgi:mRNA interferase RelE/StbE
MPFELAFHHEALREWRTLSVGIREQFKKKLAERLIEPRIHASKLRGSSHHTKIKLLAAGFRLVYDVRDRELLVLVVAVGKRERNAVDSQADQRREDFAAPRRA